MNKISLKICTIFLLFVAFTAFAVENPEDTDETTVNIQQKLEVTKDRLAYDKKQLDLIKQKINERRQTLEKVLIRKDDLDSARLELAKAEANIQSVKIRLMEANQSVSAVSSAIRAQGDALQEITLAPKMDEPLRLQIEKLKSELALQQNILALEQSRQKSLREIQQIALERVVVLSEWSNLLNTQFSEQEETRQLLNLAQEEHHLEQNLQQSLTQLAVLNQQVDTHQDKFRVAEDPQEKMELAKKIETLRSERVRAEEQSNLTQVALSLLSVKQQLASISKQQESMSVYSLRNSINRLNSISGDLEQLKKLHARKLSLLKLRREITQTQSQQDTQQKKRLTKKLDLYQQIEEEYQAQEKETNELINKVDALRLTYKQNLTKALSRRQEFPAFSAASWENLALKISDLPGFAIHSLQSLQTQLTLSIKNLSTTKLSILGGLQLLLLFIWLEGRTLLSRLATRIKEKRDSLGGQTSYVLVELLRRNWFSLLIVVTFFSWFVFSEVPFKSYSVLLWLVLVWLSFKLGIGLARLTLLEGTQQTTGHDVVLYRGLKWSMILGGVVATFTVLAHQLPVSFEVSDFFNRILMVFFVGFGLFLLQKLRILPILLAPYFKKSRPYVRFLVKLLCLLIPLAMLSNAIIGLLGYIQLAWTISKYEMIFLLVLTLYVLARGIIIDAMSTLAGFTIRNMRNGWLWTEAILKPLDRLIRLLLLFASVGGLVYIYGWHDNQAVISLINSFFKLQLFKVGESHITPLTFIELGIISIIIYWAARWSREFAYRWLFARTKDVGLRNSLAALFQYSVVGVGSYIGLQVLQIDWTGLKFMLVAFAAGIGFGLRDTANNLVSGLLLLFERPVRSGDIVTIGEHEGVVSHVGIRSLILHTWDHMDVLVPNSEIYSKSFINWTRQDPIVRITFEIKVQREDDPRRVRALIEQILVASPDVLSDPEPQVLFTQVSEALISIEVRCHINLQFSQSRVKVKSDLLFSIWKTFKEAGIRAPYPQQDIHLRSLPNKYDADKSAPFEFV